MTDGTTTGLGRWPASRREMSIGIMVPIGEGSHFGDPEPHFADMNDIVRAAAANGFEIAWFADHFTVPPAPGWDRERPTWEAFTMMAALAGANRDLGIAYGPLVACTSFRNPGGLAKLAEAIDDISGGKFILGLGAGWHKPEYDAFDYPFDHRVSRFEEAIQIVAQLLRTGESTFSGTYCTTDGAVNRPRGPLASSGGCPIMVGSSGDRMLRIMARHADAWNGGWEHDLDAVRAKLAKVRAACADVGRDPETMVLTIGANLVIEGATNRRGASFAGSDEEIARLLASYRDLGFKHFVAGLDPCTPESLARFGKIIAMYDEMS